MTDEMPIVSPIIAQKIDQIMELLDMAAIPSIFKSAIHDKLMVIVDNLQ